MQIVVNVCAHGRMCVVLFNLNMRLRIVLYVVRVGCTCVQHTRRVVCDCVCVREAQSQEPKNPMNISFTHAAFTHAVETQMCKMRLLHNDATHSSHIMCVYANAFACGALLRLGNATEALFL